jgi:hypothetical protein
MRLGEEWDDCIAQHGVQYIGGGPPRADGQGERRPGEAAALGATRSPLGLGQRLGGGSSRRLGLRLPKP